MQVTEELNQVYETFENLKNDFEFFAKECLKVKSEEGQIIPFNLNRTQCFIHKNVERQKKETGKIRILVIKARQQGSSTYFCGRTFSNILFNKGKNAFTLSHQAASTEHLLNIVKCFYDNCPEQITARARP